MYYLKPADEIQASEKYDDNLLGCHLICESTVFRVFCPRSPRVEVEIFDRYEQEEGRRIPMIRSESGVWELTLPERLDKKFYGYRVAPPSNGLPFERSNFAVADPYSKWAVVKHNYRQDPKSYIFEPEPFDWEGERFHAPADPRDLVIYEAHLKDLVGHIAPEANNLSWYERFLKAGTRGGVEYLKELGVNAVEFLPLQKFAYLEPPFNQETPEGVNNTWNPYSLNYWGYMTSFFNMPESLFAESKLPNPNEPYGFQPKAINQLKSVIKTLHQAGISVIMDVVYNHASQYDRNPFKFLDRMYYFRHDGDHNYKSYSGCGNDFRTEAPFARKFIIDSLLFWMKEFHIDGFRFDLANLIDRETLIRIREETRKVNPNIVLIAEPWGGGYNPTGFSEIGWSSWNDQIRNGVKGSDPIEDPGFIFGKWQRESSRLSLENYLRGTLTNAPNGRYLKSTHSVNYLESHDGYTLGDFIRTTYSNHVEKQFKSRRDVEALKGHELKSAKLAALYLMVSQGVAMIHAGQEFARAKVIENSDVPDREMHRLDHNSYNKDNWTNYIDFEEISKNRELYYYYKGLIRLRRNSPGLRKARPDSVHFTNYEDALHITFSIKDHGTKDPFEYYISINGNPEKEQLLHLPPGFWHLMVSETVASDVPISVISGIVKVAPLSGIVLRKMSSDDQN